MVLINLWFGLLLLLFSQVSIFQTRILWSWCALKRKSPETMRDLMAPLVVATTLLLLVEDWRRKGSLLHLLISEVEEAL